MHLRRYLLLLALALAPALIRATPPVEIMSAGEAKVARLAWLTAPGGHSWTTAGFTGSMRPSILGGELLLIERYTGQPLSRGMLVIAPRWDSPAGVLHVIRDIDGPYIRTQGTACMYPDPWCRRDRIRWIVRRVIRSADFNLATNQ